MNWRTLGGLFIVMTCLSSFQAAIASDCLGWEVPLVLALISSCGYAGYKIWRNTIYKYDNLRMCFINHLPQEEYGVPPIEESPFQIKIVPLGPQTLTFKVVSVHGFPVKHVNARFLNADSSNADGKLIEITDMNDPYYHIGRQRDGNFGIDGEYADMRVLSSGQGLYFQINIIAHKPWRGLFSFRAQDTGGVRTFARQSFESSKDATQAPSHPIYTMSSSAHSVSLEIIKPM